MIFYFISCEIRIEVYKKIYYRLQVGVKFKQYLHPE